MRCGSFAGDYVEGVCCVVCGLERNLFAMPGLGAQLRPAICAHPHTCTTQLSASSSKLSSRMSIGHASMMLHGCRGMASVINNDSQQAHHFSRLAVAA
mmetsp:Transcript_725/g.913  ORF Transcript_725/g.913 Transcript_725/m.913 type:complete len:98 (+) Transcript_725:95-388(+)